MPLTQAQRTIVERARAVGGGEQGIALTDEACCYVVATIVSDLSLTDRFPEFKGKDLSPFFGNASLETLVVKDVSFVPLFERLVSLCADADTYFACLAALHKARLKYERILRTQPIPTIEQVGPRGLLQFGSVNARALAALLFWRKWFYDLDNRAGQETGYLFEPVIANAIGGAPVGSKRSPVKRAANKAKGRQVDCIREKHAYEFKMRVTIAASGQGRWGEELQFPVDCKQSGFTPVLIVLDSTANPKLEELTNAFLAQDGEVYVGEEAWKHLEGAAGATMTKFLEKYIREPLKALIQEKIDLLPDFHATMDAKTNITLAVADEKIVIMRNLPKAEAEPPDEMPEDVDEGLPGL